MSKHIFNDSNYQTILNHSDIKTYISVYNKIISNYLDSCCDALQMKDNKYYTYILLKGITTIQTVFSFLLLYTKNIEIISTHCEKAYLYFIEFIGQIGGDNTSYLQLNCKDAILFVYKKTIYDINSEYKKNFKLTEKERHIINIINESIQINFTYVSYIINHFNPSLERIENLNILKDLSISLANKLLIIVNSEKLELSQEKLNNIHDLLNKVETKNLSIEGYCCLIEYFCKKINKTKHIINIKYSKIFDDNFDENMKKMSASKFIQWLST